MIITDSPGLFVQYDSAASLLRAAWRAGQPLASFRPALEWLMDFSRRHQIRNWLVDMHHVPPLGPVEQVWIAQEWFAAMTVLPVRQLALILPPDMHNQQVATDPIHNPALQPSFELHFFTDAASAFHWLLAAAPNREALGQEWLAQF